MSCYIHNNLLHVVTTALGAKNLHVVTTAFGAKLLHVVTTALGAKFLHVVTTALGAKLLHVVTTAFGAYFFGNELKHCESRRNMDERTEAGIVGFITLQSKVRHPR